MVLKSELELELFAEWPSHEFLCPPSRRNVDRAFSDGGSDGNASRSPVVSIRLSGASGGILPTKGMILPSCTKTRAQVIIIIHLLGLAPAGYLDAPYNGAKRRHTGECSQAPKRCDSCHAVPLNLLNRV
jgi:hypothetical protein